MTPGEVADRHTASRASRPVRDAVRYQPCVPVQHHHRPSSLAFVFPFHLLTSLPPIAPPLHPHIGGHGTARSGIDHLAPDIPALDSPPPPRLCRKQTPLKDWKRVDRPRRRAANAVDKERQYSPLHSPTALVPASPHCTQYHFRTHRRAISDTRIHPIQRPPLPLAANTPPPASPHFTPRLSNFLAAGPL